MLRIAAGIIFVDDVGMMCNETSRAAVEAEVKILPQPCGSWTASTAETLAIDSGQLQCLS